MLSAVEGHAKAVAKACDNYAYVVSPNGVVVQDNPHSDKIGYTAVLQTKLWQFLETIAFPTAAQQASINAIQRCAAKGYEYPCEGK